MIRKSLLIVAGCALSAALYAQGTTLYSNKPGMKAQNMGLRHWGSGTIAETAELKPRGGNYSIRVSTRNYFQGGSLLFFDPKDMSKLFEDKNNLLKFTYRNADEATKLGGATPAGGGGGGGGGQDDEGRRNSAAGGGALQKGGATPPAGGTAASNLDTVLKFVRIIITTTDNMKSEAYIELRPSGGIAGWREAAIPLQGIDGFDKTNKIIREIAFSGDVTATFYIADIKVIDDTTKIEGDVNADRLNLALGDEVQLVANGWGGATPLKYTWDFDEADGIQVDAEGQVVKHKFRKAGEYMVTATIGDRYGMKPGVVRKIKVTVNP